MRRLPFLLSWTFAPAFCAWSLCAWSALAHAQDGRVEPAAKPGVEQRSGVAPEEPSQGPPADAIGAEPAPQVETELDDERARAHFSAGEAYFGVERYDDAAREFALAYELSRRPEMLVNLSRAHERGGELRAAVADLELLLELYPASSYRGEALERIARMRAQLVAPPRAIAASEVTAVHEPQAAQSVQPERSGWPSWTTLSLVAGAGASAVVALGTGGRAHRIYKQLEGRCPDDTCAWAFEDERTHGRRLARTSTGFTFAAVALAGAATVLWVYEARARKRRIALGMTFDGFGSNAHLRAQF